VLRAPPSHRLELQRQVLKVVSVFHRSATNMDEQKANMISYWHPESQARAVECGRSTAVEERDSTKAIQALIGD
jgi:hypothetical protein